MTNSALNTRTVLASAARLAGADTTQRCGVVLRRTEYTVPNAPAHVGHRDIRRVAFVVRLDGGIGSELVTVDQRLDAIAAVINEGDQVEVTRCDNVHVESTVQPVFAWGFADTINDGDKVFGSRDFLNNKGELCTSSIVLGANGLVIVVDGSNDNLGASEVSSRVGVILKHTVYKNGAHRPSSAPLIGTFDQMRVTFMVRLDGGIGSELVTVDQILDATAALLKDGDQVEVRLSENVHAESTVHPVHGWTVGGDTTGGKVLRQGEFIDAQGRLSLASLVLGAGKQGLIVQEEPLVLSRAA